MESQSEIGGIPSRIDLMNPVLAALRELGGSSSLDEMLRHVMEELGLSNEVVDAARLEGRRTDLRYNLAWARTYLKKLGLITNSQRGIWSLTVKGREKESIDAREAWTIDWGETSTNQLRRNLSAEELSDPEDDSIADWRDQLLGVLRELEPGAFERLCQLLLRESGFTEVVVTGRTGDGGIDGKGIVRIGGFISFPVLFQCKRYSGNVGAPEVRNFRGAMAGRASRGMLVTTGGFTSEALAEATREGAEPIDLIDAKLLTDKMKEFGLGVKTEMVEQVSIDRELLEGI